MHEDIWKIGFRNRKHMALYPALQFKARVGAEAPVMTADLVAAA